MHLSSCLSRTTIRALRVLFPSRNSRLQALARTEEEPPRQCAFSGETYSKLHRWTSTACLLGGAISAISVGCAVDASETVSREQSVTPDCVNLQTWVGNDWRTSIAAGETIQHEGEKYRANQTISYPNGECAPDNPVSWCSTWFSHVGTCGEDSGSTDSCDDGIQNQGEEGVDCGGPCEACVVEATCDDGTQNQGEEGVDCGGPCEACVVEATCEDGTQNQGEEGVDCGGPCEACVVEATCDDGTQNQGEEGVDCGGPCSACSGAVLVPGKIEAEDFARFEDSTPGHFGDCGSGPVDQQETGDDGGRCNVGWTVAGEWLEYDIFLDEAGEFDFVLRLAANQSGKRVAVSIDGTTVGSVTSPGLGWQTWADRSLSGVSISEGAHTVRLTFLDGSTNLNWLEVSGADSTGTAGSGFTNTPFGQGPAYCRSLDPSWENSYTTETDRALARIIGEKGLEGDPGLFVNDEGECEWRALPRIEEPVSELGRALFFSFDLSGDQDVACATCHHPALGGGDALSLSIGPADDPNAMGADRARGLTDVSTIHVPRNANTTYNIAFWDDGLFWDSRVQSLDRTAGENGDRAGIATPDSSAWNVADPEAGANLTVAQALFPVTEAHEMAGSWAALHPERQELRDALAARMAGDWGERFAAVCDEPGLPASWVDACAEPNEAVRNAELVTFSHIAAAVGEYERTQNFTDSPWRAYVQGDVDAISEGAKRGALLFFQTLNEGGQNCSSCHTGDFFTDELFHAVGSPQIGPGKESGLDAGRALVTGDNRDAYQFRTPTLLNVSATGPYFHSGAYATLTRTVQHYDNQNGRLFEYFGEGNKSEEGARPWCQMTQFRDIPECNSLYTMAGTHGGRLNNFLDPEASDIQTLEDLNYVYLTAFLETLTDPTVLDPAALAPWIDPDSTLNVTETSSEWGVYCDEQIERSADINLRIKGFRWMLRGALARGDVNTDARLYDTFGVDEWIENRTRFTAETGVQQRSRELSSAVLEVLTAPQRQILYAAYNEMSERGNQARIHALRTQVFEQMNVMRDGQSVNPNLIEALIVDAAALEAEDLFTIAQAYRAVRDALGGNAQEEQLQVLAAIEKGDLSALPAGVYVPGETRLSPSNEITQEIRNAVDANGVPWDNFASGYLSWSLGWDCRFTFMTRMDEGERRANYYGFSPWAGDFLFDLTSGAPGNGGFQLEMSEYIAEEEQRLGLSTFFTNTLDATLAIRTDYNTARAVLVARLRDVHESGLPEGDLEAAVIAANEAVGQADAQLLLAELSYYTALWSRIESRGGSPLPEYLACIESPETQARRGIGGVNCER